MHQTPGERVRLSASAVPLTRRGGAHGHEDEDLNEYFEQLALLEPRQPSLTRTPALWRLDLWKETCPKAMVFRYAMDSW
jgi:hypothetical protein